MAKSDDTIPGLQLDPSLEAKLDNLDEHLEPIEKDLKENEKPDIKEKGEEKPAEEKKEEQPAKEDEPKEPAKEEEPEGYTIDDGIEESESEEEEPTTPTEEKTSNLTAEQQYIIDNLTPITVRGTVGTDEVKEFNVYSPEYLPQGFKFVDDREMSAANKSFGMLESRALQLQNDYRNQETQKATVEYKQREDTADRQDIAQLQKDGSIPLFKADRDTADFEKDPGVVLVQEILDFKEAENQKYLEQYNAGRPYKHIGFEEAFRLYQRENPTKSNPEQTKEDKEREEIAKRTSKTNGAPSTEERPKARAHSGMTAMDLENLIESKTAGW